MKQEKRITYQAGITRTPSDFLCNDGELAECINLTTDNEELKPIVQPKLFIDNASHKLLFVHYITGSNTPQYIYSGVAYGDGNTYTPTDTTIVQAVGNIVIFNDTAGLNYMIWNGTGYKYLGSRIPIPSVKFRLEKHGEKTHVVNSASCEGILELEWDTIDGNDYGYVNVVEYKQEEYNNLVVGLYTKNLKSIANLKCFAEPFMVCVALELYDGSYIYQSTPQLLFPSVRSNSYLTTRVNNKTSMSTGFRKLFFNANFDYKEWADIVKDVVVFITRGTKVYDTTCDQTPKKTYDNSVTPQLYWDCIYHTSDTSLSNPLRNIYRRNTICSVPDTNHILGAITLPLNPYDDKDIIKSIKSDGIFYRLASIGKNRQDGNNWVDITSYIEAHVLENIESQQRLSIDYFSKCKLFPNVMKSLNSRLHIANCKRDFADIDDYILPYDNQDSHTYAIYVRIKTLQGEVLVTLPTISTKQIQGIYFYYPDPRAFELIIGKYDGGRYTYTKFDLTEHCALNGAFCLNKLPDGDDDLLVGGASQPSPTGIHYDYFPDRLYVSEVHNPFYFGSKGVVAVEGTIKSVSSTTTALSTGQFGQYPLLVFTDKGIWALSVDETGLYKASHPMSREICINSSSVTQTDGAVFFVSKKGLMVVVGGEVKCVSEQINGIAFNTVNIEGLRTADLALQDAPTDDWKSIIQACQSNKTFLEFVRDENCKIAYDYIASMLLIINHTFNFSYVYSIIDGSISKIILPSLMKNVVNAYPDYLMQDDNYKIFTLYDKDREEQVQTRQTAFLLTRPMKLAGPSTVVSLQELVNVGAWDEGTTQAPLSVVKTDVWCSDNNRDWYLMKSRMGAAAKYFRIGLYIKMLPTERLSGTIVMEEERRTNNQRV